MTPHFTLRELIRSDYAARHGIPNLPGPEARENLKRLAEFLEECRSALENRPIQILSGYRSRLLNAAVGGSSRSQHLTGLAADVVAAGLPPTETCKRLLPLPFDQLILEYDEWTHVSIPAVGVPSRREALVMDRAGTRPMEVT